MEELSRHYQNSLVIPASAEDIFAYADNHQNFSSHMNKSSWMMGGSRMETRVDDGQGQAVGSHIYMDGKVFGIKLSLDEVVTKREPPRYKEWQTVGNPKLLIIGHYRMSFEISSDGNTSKFKVSIDYELPKSLGGSLLGSIFGGTYAKWCVQQMLTGTQSHFSKK